MVDFLNFLRNCELQICNKVAENHQIGQITKIKSRKGHNSSYLELKKVLQNHQKQPL